MLLQKQGTRRQWTPREVVSGPITKDEEEVAETLYALAGMFPDNGSNQNSKELEGESLQNLEDNASAALALEGYFSFSRLSGILVKLLTHSCSFSLLFILPWILFWPQQLFRVQVLLVMKVHLEKLQKEVV